MTLRRSPLKASLFAASRILNKEDDEMNWEYCVSTASSFLSLDWEEHFFPTREEAEAFDREARKLGKVTLIVARDEY